MDNKTQPTWNIGFSQYLKWWCSSKDEVLRNDVLSQWEFLLLSLFKKRTNQNQEWTEQSIFLSISCELGSCRRWDNHHLLQRRCTCPQAYRCCGTCCLSGTCWFGGRMKSRTTRWTRTSHRTCRLLPEIFVWETPTNIPSAENIPSEHRRRTPFPSVEHHSGPTHVPSSLTIVSTHFAQKPA